MQRKLLQLEPFIVMATELITAWIACVVVNSFDQHGGIGIRKRDQLRQHFSQNPPVVLSIMELGRRSFSLIDIVALSRDWNTGTLFLE